MTDVPAEARFEFNRPANPDSEALGMRVLEQLFPRILDAEAKMKGEYVAVIDDRSSLRLDDRYLGRWRTGSLHVTAMSAAVDALLLLRTTLQPVLMGTHALPMSALYPIIRAAIESAALAIYLLEPNARDERLRRSYLVAAEDGKYHGTFSDALGNENWADLRENARDEIRRLIATRPALGDPTLFRFSDLTYSGMVINADAVIRRDPVVPNQERRLSLLAWWKLLSGLSHGKQWAFVEAMERSEAIVDVANESAQIRMTSSMAAIALAVQRAVEAIEVALRLYGRRSKVTWAQVEDSEEPPTVPHSEL